MIASLWANSNYDDDKNTRQRAIEEIEESYEQAIRGFLNPSGSDEEDIDKSNPFFEAMEKGVAKLEQPRNDEGTVNEAILGKDTDQG